jgi:hypothetical protein
MVALAIGCWVQYAVLRWTGGPSCLGAATVLDLVHGVILVGLVQTFWVRLRRILRELQG